MEFYLENLLLGEVLLAWLCVALNGFARRGVAWLHAACRGMVWRCVSLCHGLCVMRPCVMRPCVLCHVSLCPVPLRHVPLRQVPLLCNCNVRWSFIWRICFWGNLWLRGGIYCFDVGGSVCVFFNDCNGAFIFDARRRSFFFLPQAEVLGKALG